MSNNGYIPRRAMSIYAHPDDQEFSIGGTLAKWARAGCEIISVIITSGDSGSNDPSKDGSYKQELAELREKEQLAANARTKDSREDPEICIHDALVPRGGPTCA